MAKQLYLFNPDHDLALANGDPNYVSPRSARQMKEELAQLPLWYASAGDAILLLKASKSGITEEMSQLLSPTIQLIKEEELTLPSSFDPSPWGWNPMLRTQLVKLGLAESLLPGNEQLNSYREWSHRRTSSALLQELHSSPYHCGLSTVLTTDAEVAQFMKVHPVCLLKEPISGSGKGLMWCKGEYTLPIRQWCKRIISRQTCVMGEPVYQKVTDFALEFRSNGLGEVRFSGYSLFCTDERGAYKNNCLASDACIEQKLGALVPLECLHALREELCRKLSVLLGTHYQGYLGIDMMICSFPTSPHYRIHPCVELNLRMNMGILARLFYDHYVQYGKHGIFQVDYFTSPNELLANHQQQHTHFPLKISNGKIVSGYLALTPVEENNKYRAFIRINRE